MTQDRPPDETCAKCGKKFVCQADQDECWCDDMKLTGEQRAALAKLGVDGCLCRECLASL